MRPVRGICVELTILVIFVVVYSALAVWALQIAQNFQSQDNNIDFAFAVALVAFLLLKLFLLTFTVFKSVARHEFEKSTVKEIVRLKKTALLDGCLLVIVLATCITLVSRLAIWQETFRNARDRTNFIYCVWCLTILCLDTLSQLLVLLALMLLICHGDSRFVPYIRTLTLLT